MSGVCGGRGGVCVYACYTQSIHITHNVDTKNTAFSVRNSRPSNLLVPTLRAQKKSVQI